MLSCLGHSAPPQLQPCCPGPLTVKGLACAQDLITLVSIVKGLLPTALVLRACKYFAAALPSLRQERVNELADGVLQYKADPDVQALLQAIDSKARGGPRF